MSKVEQNPLHVLWNSATKEMGRVAQEAQKHVTESINDIAKGVETGGFIGGAATALDKLSLGNIAVGALDSVIPGEDLPKPLAEGLSGVVNLMSGNPMGYVDVVQGFMALGKQQPNSQARQAAPGQAQLAVQPQRMQTPESPSEASRTWAPRLQTGLLQAPVELGGAFISRTPNGVVVNGSGKADDISLDRQANGSYKLTVNGESMTLSARDVRGLVINGGGGDDKIVVDGNRVRVNGGSGNDVVVVNGNNARASGGSGNDTVVVNGDNGRASGGSGNDRLIANGDNARMIGGRGNDRLIANGDNARLVGGRGNDDLRLRGDNGVAFGGKGNDVLRERGDGNRLVGGPGNDSRIYEHGLRIRDYFPFEFPKSFKDRAIDIGTGGFTVNDGLTDGLRDIADILQPGKEADATQKKLREMEKRAAEATAELDRILNNPDLGFEDMIFMLMGALMKQAQKDVKAMTAETREQKAAFDKQKLELTQGVNAAESKVNELEAKVRANPDDKEAAKQLGAAKSDLRKLGEERNEKVSEFNDSRQEQLEAIKNAMNKITEMQQTLSNILNSMHQTAMSTIGNIR